MFFKKRLLRRDDFFRGRGGDCGTIYPYPCSTTPLRVVTELRFERIDAGQGHTCALAAQGQAYCWGASWRMTRAEELLREGASVARAAEQVGYANPVAFSKAFARLRGTGPGAIRRERRRPSVAGQLDAS